MLIDHFRWIGLLAKLWCIHHTEKKVRKWVIYFNPASTQTIRQPKPNRWFKGALYKIQILCRRYTFWSYPAGLIIADSPG